MNFQNPPYTPAAASQRIRILWQKFELSQAKDRAQLDSTIQAALEKAEAEWNKSPINIRISRIQRNATKAKIAKRIKAPYFDAARAKWHEMLEPLGLKPDYWTDLTEDEKRRITNTLGAEDESDEDAVVPEVPSAPTAQPPQPHFFQPLAPSFSTSSRATNLSSSSYAFVNPSEFNSEEEDFEYEIPISNPVATSVDLTSEDDDDPIASIPNYSGSRASLLGSAFSRASLSASNPSSNTPYARPLVSGFAYNAASTGPVPTKRAPPPPPQPSQVSQNEAKATITPKAKIPRQPYVGPSLDAPEEPIDEDLEFEKFKMRTRMAKIVEFHEAAALAEISLSIEMYKARKQLNNSKEEDAPRVLEHQKRMVQLQKEKEEERKAIVKSERARRQSELARRSTLVGDDVVVKGLLPPKSNGGGAFKTWDPSSFQEEINLPSRFNLETLLTDDPAKQQTNVENLLSEMFADDYSGVNGSTPGFFNGSSSTFPNPDAFRGSSSSSIYNQQSHSSMSWNKTRTNSSPQRKTHLSPFGESSDEEDDNTPASIKPNAPTPAITSSSAWHSTKDGATPVNGAWSSKKSSGPTTQPRQGSNILSNPNPSFAMDDIEPEPTATPIMNSKGAKGKKASVLASDKSPVLPPPTVETATASSKAPVSETPVVPPTPAPALAPAPAGKKQNKKQRQAANKKGGAAAAAAAPTTAAATPEQEPETEPILPQQQQQRESPKLEAPVVVAAPNPITPQTSSEHSTWLPKTSMARTRMDSEQQPQPQPQQPTPSFFSWDEITSTPRPASKIPAHVQESLKSEGGGTVRPSSMLKKKNLMAEIFSATSSRTTLDQMPPTPTTATPISSSSAAAAKGPVWGGSTNSTLMNSIPSSVTPGPSLWGKTKADFGVQQQQQQPVAVAVAGGRDSPWVPGGFDSVGGYKVEGDGGGGGGGGNEGGSRWGSISSHSKQNGKPTSIPATQRLRRVSEATATASSSSPAIPRGFGTKDLSSDIGKQQHQQHAAKATPAPAPASLAANNNKKAQGKKNGKGKQRATIEVVSDEEKDNIDILPQDSNYIMEPKVILEQPKPSVPSFVYNPIIDFAGTAADGGNGSENYDHYDHYNGVDDDDDAMNDIAYLASTFRPTASSSSQDDFFSNESSLFSSNPFKTTTTTTTTASTMGSAAAAADWGGGGAGKHARWTPAVTNFNLKNDDEEEENLGLPSFPISAVASLPPPPPSRLSSQAAVPAVAKAKSVSGGGGVQQTPIWGQPNPSAKDNKGKGKKK